ncbi:MAG: DMT family transporter [Patescibacteria group bacterium]
MSYGPLFIFIAALLWALDGILRRSLYSLPASTIVFYEHLIGAIILLPFLWRAWGRETLTRKEWGVVAGVALLSGVLGTLFFTAALLKVNFIPFSVVILLQKLQPIFAVAAAAIVLKEHVTKSYLGWAALALVAGYFVTFPYGIISLADGGAQVTAALLAVLAAAAWGSSTAFSRYTLLNHSHTFITGLRFWLTVPLAFLFVLALGAAPSLGTITQSQLLTLAAIACSTGMLALWIYYKGLKTTPARVSTIVELAFPATAVVIDYFLYDTTLAWTQYVAAFVLLFAMYRVAKIGQ